MLLQAGEDLKTAELLLEHGRYYASVFFSQQTTEKALKALYVYTKRESPRTHNLVDLAEMLNSPQNILEAAMELNPDYVTTRYVNAANGVPAKMYSQKSAETHLDYAREVLVWTKQLIK